MKEAQKRTMKKTIIGVIGGATVSPETEAAAYRLGALIARRGWVLLNGGRAAGVMDASARGAREKGGLTVGILPGVDSDGASEWIDIPLFTGMGMARNAINVLSSDVVIACPGGAGTLSEIALALKSGRKTILLGFDAGGAFAPWEKKGLLLRAAEPEDAVALAGRLLAAEDPRAGGDGGGAGP